mmetsp:Transcript_9621/g.25699  ORF Transcript_9621/g.25699 Transcript_9621/m.25699 type:complete len:233 (+) Transcript_9621:172-870(+)
MESSNKHYCKTCGVWMPGGKAQREQHERASKHRERERLELRAAHERNENERKRQASVKAQLERIESLAALKARGALGMTVTDARSRDSHIDEQRSVLDDARSRSACERQAGSFESSAPLEACEESRVHVHPYGEWETIDELPAARLPSVQTRDGVEIAGLGSGQAEQSCAALKNDAARQSSDDERYTSSKVAGSGASLHRNDGQASATETTGLKTTFRKRKRAGHVLKNCSP